MIERLAILGATGDLTMRYLLPALARLDAAGALPAGFRVTAIGLEELSSEEYRSQVAGAFPADAHASAELVRSFEYARADVASAQALGRALGSLDTAVAAYLALPPALFEAAVRALAEVGLPDGSRIVVEKPFGEDLASAQRLNAVLRETVGEAAVHRVDHFLGKQTVQNLLGLRFANRIFEPLWNRQHVQRIEIVWDEELTAQGRAGYYDHAGALRDMVQNHLLQLLCLVAMEPPATLGERDLRDRKVDVLRAVRRPSPEEVERTTRRARYAGGSPGGHDVPAYVEETGVDPARDTETFAQVTLEIENWRWAGVPFVLRTGKALGQSRQVIVIHFHPVPHLAFGQEEEPAPNELRLELDPDRISLSVSVNGRDDPFTLEPLELDAALAPQDLPAYGHVLLGVLAGDSTLSIRGDEAEEAWRIVEPILAAWTEGRPSLSEYPAGSAGPPPSAAPPTGG